MTLAVRDLRLPQLDGDAAPGRFVAAFPENNPPPFILQMKRADGLVVAQEVNVDVYGAGEDEKAAIGDFLDSARRHLRLLTSEERLSPRLSAQLEYLRERLDP